MLISCRTLLLKVANRWLLLKGLSRITHQKSRKFPRETSEPEFRYSLTIGFAFSTNFSYPSEAYHDPNHESINFRFWSLFNLEELTQILYIHLQSFKP